MRIFENGSPPTIASDNLIWTEFHCSLNETNPISDLVKLLIPPELGMRLARVGAELAARSRVSE